MNVTITGRPWYEASEKGVPRWSTSENAGAGRSPAAKVAALDEAAGDELRELATSATTAAIARPARAAPTQIAQRNRWAAPGRRDSAAIGGFADTRCSRHHHTPAARVRSGHGRPRRDGGLSPLAPRGDGSEEAGRGAKDPQIGAGRSFGPVRRSHDRGLSPLAPRRDRPELARVETAARLDHPLHPPAHD